MTRVASLRDELLIGGAAQTMGELWDGPAQAGFVLGKVPDATNTYGGKLVALGWIDRETFEIHYDGDVISSRVRGETSEAAMSIWIDDDGKALTATNRSIKAVDEYLAQGGTFDWVKLHRTTNLNNTHQITGSLALELWGSGQGWILDSAPVTDESHPSNNLLAEIDMEDFGHTTDYPFSIGVSKHVNPGDFMDAHGPKLVAIEGRNAEEIAIHYARVLNASGNLAVSVAVLVLDIESGELENHIINHKEATKGITSKSNA